MRAVLLGSVLMLAACSGQQSGNASANGASATAPGTATTPSSLNLTDACATLPRDEVARAVGQPLREAELKDVMTDTGNGMASSSCVYDFGDARLVILNLQRFPDGADMASIFDGTRSMLSKDGATAAEDVSGLGQRAFWVPSSGDLYVMLGDNRQVALSIARLDIPDAKDKMVALARRVVG